MQQNDFMNLEEEFGRLLSKLNAMELMMLGLMQMQAPYADGINEVYGSIKESTEKMRKLLVSIQAKE